MAKLIKNNFGSFILILVLLAVFIAGFLFFKNLSVKAQEQTKIIPESFSGDWHNAEAVFSQDLGPEATLEEFNERNSTHLLETLKEELIEEEIELPLEIPTEEITTFTEESATSTDETATSTEEVISPEPEQEIATSTEETEEIATSTEETIIVPEETATSTVATSTAETKKPSFFTGLWTKIKNLFNSEVRAESSACKSGSNRPCGTEIGACQIGVEICQQGVWGECIGAMMPSQEICDGVDNDCDGQIDEGIICGENAQSSSCQNGSNQPCGTEVGACQIGVEICQQGVWGECIGAMMPSQEICDGVDNDCDDQVDEDGVCGGVPSSTIPLTKRVLTLSGFGISLAENTEIKLVQLRMSLAGRGEAGDSLVIDYFYQNVWHNLEMFDLENEISNALNEGYFLYGLPIFQKAQDLDNLKIRFTYLSETEQKDSSSVFLEAVWLEIETEEVTGEVITSDGKGFSLKSIKKDWKRNEEPEFEIVEAPESFWGKIGSVFDKKEIEATLIDPRGGENLEEVIIQDNKIKIIQTNLRGFRPGLYKLKVKIIEGGEEFVLEQEFAWGVLAINFNKSVYLPNETAYLQMAALRDDGDTICDANLKLEIISPNSAVAYSEIERSGECWGNNVTDVPDYFAFYQVQGPGTYQAELTNLDNGYEITDSFEVRDSIPFDIERIGPTRIWPWADYEITLLIKANQDFAGEVIEYVPDSFEIESQNSSLKTTFQNSKLIIWQVDWKAGEIHEIKYTFDAPNISPYLYLLGPLQVGSFQEARTWQIASDATFVEYLKDGSSWDVPGDWNALDNSIEVIGGGGGGADGATGQGVGGGGGGSGAYARIINLDISSPITYGVGATGTIATAGTDTWFNAESAAACVDSGVCVKGKGGGGASGSTAGTATAGSIGTTVNAGANGGTGGAIGGKNGGGGGGGAGAGGPSGVGTAGSNAALAIAGAGGQGNDAVGGAGGTAGGGDGGDGDCWTSNPGAESAGSGGGGGGGTGGSNKAAGSPAGAAGAYGAAGGGGGGAGDGSATVGNGSQGTQGIIVITYTPAGANVAPSIASITSFHFNEDITTISEWAPGGTTYNATTTFTVTDDNGWDDISTTTIYVYRSGVTNCSSTDDLDIVDCYPSTSTDSSWSPYSGSWPNYGRGAICALLATGTDYIDFQCTTTLQYCADATDTGSAYDAQWWEVYASTSDKSGDYARVALGNVVDIATNRALILSPATINYNNATGSATLGAGDTTGGGWATTTVTTTGNVAVDVHFDGGNLVSAGKTSIPAYKQHFTTTTYANYTDADVIQLASSTDNGFTGETHDLTMARPTTTTPGPTTADELYWGIGIPDYQASGTYSSTTDLTATSTVRAP